MQADPVVALSHELKSTDRAFDRALVARNAEKAAALGERLKSLTAELHMRAPTTPRGAAILLREAASALRDSDATAAKKLARTLNPIARRMARGNPAQADSIALRAAESLARQALDASDGLDIVPGMIARALQGATAPMLVSDTGEPAPRARSRARLYVVA